MKIVETYLNVLYEQFNARVALTDIDGDFKNDWTNCFEIKCHRQLENKYEKNICKDDCRIRAATQAIARVISAKVKCTTAQEPNRCVNTMENGILRYRKMILAFKESQSKANAKYREFKTKSGA